MHTINISIALYDILRTTVLASAAASRCSRARPSVCLYFPPLCWVISCSWKQLFLQVLLASLKTQVSRPHSSQPPRTIRERGRNRNTRRRKKKVFGLQTGASSCLRVHGGVWLGHGARGVQRLGARTRCSAILLTRDGLYL